MKEHALIAATMGVKQIIVAINKTETSHKKSFYQEIVENTLECLKKVGYSPANVIILPIATYNGLNLFNEEVVAEDNADAPQQNNEAGKVTNLVQALHSLKTPKRPVNKPLRIPIETVYRIGGVGTVVCGKIESGELQVGQDVQIF